VGKLGIGLSQRQQLSGGGRNRLVVDVVGDMVDGGQQFTPVGQDGRFLQSLLAAVSTEADQVGQLLVGTVDRVEEVPGDRRIGQGRRAEVGDHQNGQTGEYEARE